MTDRDGDDQAFVDAISEWPDINDGPPTLAGFLLARIAEDEAELRVEQVETTTYDDLSRGERTFVPGRPLANPDRRRLAECEAKRRIIDECVVAAHVGHPGVLALADRRERIWWRVLALLALPYADHPEYQEAWRP